ncbi:hypothetical protein niasHS_015833 [Heterodera schachtii]|uniref:glucuronosyltransferase n=1 Tax=Heterodera schachtii TaxID=97005 RepID=A0ABD2HVW4_HETSC
MLFFARLFFLLFFFFATTNGTIKTAKAQSAPGKKKLKILVYSVVPAHSHMQFMGAIADSLAEAGHEVHFIKTISDELRWSTEAESNETKLSTKVYRVVLKSRGAPVATSDVLYPFSGDNAWPMLNAWDNRFEFTETFAEIAFRRELLDELAKERYDVAIYELFDLCGAAIFERIGVRTKLATLTMPMQQISAAHFGIPTFASFVPNLHINPVQRKCCSPSQQQRCRFTVLPVKEGTDLSKMAQNRQIKFINSDSDSSSSDEEASSLSSSSATTTITTTTSIKFNRQRLSSILRNAKKFEMPKNAAFCAGRVVHFADSCGQPLASFRLIPSWREDSISME